MQRLQSACRWLLCFSTSACPLLAWSDAQAPAGSWYQTPSKLQVGDMPLDTANPALGGYFDSNPSDAFGHAAPFLADVDGDGKRDLTVGSFSGRFRYYR